MNIFKRLLFLLLVINLMACDDSEVPRNKPEPPVVDMSGFARGADVSWLTEMESQGLVFYDSLGLETECLTLLKGMGMNAVRLRVWLNPGNGWCNKSDFLVKAKRANDLGMRIMVDFHYSDSWADPSQQNKPKVWEALSFEELCTAVRQHTHDVLSNMENWGITPEWVQVGNETGNGMLWEEGRASENMAQYAALNNCGYEEAKAVFPDVKVIVHLQEGNRNSLFRWLFDGLKSNGGKWDVIGMSLYPSADNWQELNNNCLTNVQDMISRYGSEIMICEVGMDWDQEEASYSFLKDLIGRTGVLEGCLGVFYWEPQSYGGWKDYQKGAFDASGSPTKAMWAFKKD